MSSYRNNFLKLVIASVSLASLAISTAGFAQDPTDQAEADDGGLALEEVIVTARKREESLMDVPIAVTAFDGIYLNEVAVEDILFATQSSPNTTLKASRATNSTLTAFIRGIGQQDPLVGFEPGVGLYLDDIYIARPQGAIFQVYDVERIEIMRGPQGTLYGRNTIGGAIKYVTKKLPDEPEAKLELAVGSFKQVDGVFTGSIPVTETVRIGASIASFNRDGFGDNLFTGAENYDKDILSGRVSLELLPSENFFLRLAADYTEDNSGDRSGHRLTVGGLSGAPILDDVFDTRAGAAASQSTAGIGGRNELEAKGASMLMEWYLNDAVTIKSITAWREDFTETVIDFESLPVMDLDAVVLYDNEQFSQEFQFHYNTDRWTGLFGLYYLDADASNDFDVVLGQLHPLGVTGFSFAVTGTKAWAAFTDITFDINEAWALSVGGRYTSDERTATVLRETYLGFGSSRFGNENAIFLGATSSYSGERKDEEFTPKVSVKWSPNDDHNIYLSYSEGFKGGSFDPRGSNFTNPDVVNGYAPEFVDTFELGAKSSWAGGRGQTTIALFNNDYTDQQIPGSVLVDTDGDGINDDFVGTVTNAGKSESKGFEFEGSYMATDSLLLRGMVSYIDAEFKEYVVGGVDISDVRVIQNTPEWTAFASFDYRWDTELFNRGGEFGLIGSWSYKSKTHLFEIADPVIDQGSYSLFDLSFIWMSDDGRYLLGLHGKNLADEEYRVAAYNFPAPTLGLEGSVTGFYGNPRTFTATAQINF